jgi:hypothetical protein
VAKSDRSPHTISLDSTSSFHIGELDDPPEYVLGSIDRVVRTDSMIAILDSRSLVVRFYDPEGRFLASAGGPGSGPGEFARPNGLGIDSSGNIYVTDIRLTRLSVFRLGRDSVTLKASMPLNDIAPYDICALDRFVVIHGVGLRNGTNRPLLHVFDRDLADRRSFGQIYETDNSTIENALSSGTVVCVPPETIVFAPSSLPLILAFSVDGDLLWVSELADFRPFPYVEYPGRIVNPVPDEGAHVIASLAKISGGWLLVQTGRVTQQSIQGGSPYADLDSYVLNISNGQGTYLGDHLPLVVDVAEYTALVKQDAPFPRLFIRPVEALLPRNAAK